MATFEHLLHTLQEPVHKNKLFLYNQVVLVNAAVQVKVKYVAHIVQSSVQLLPSGCLVGASIGSVSVQKETP
jgi:hypothetical protein